MSVVEHGSSPPSRWLHERRWRFALWIAVAEAIIVAFSHNVTKWTVFALALLAFAFYYYVGRKRGGLVHEVSFIFGASQVLALSAAILALIISTLAFIVAGIFAAVAIAFFLLDRR